MPVLQIEFKEFLSDVFYAGWKVSDNSVSLTKSGSTTLRLEQTLPIGCRYTEGDNLHCLEELSFKDPLQNLDLCSAGIRVQDASDLSKSSIFIQTLKKGQEWETNKLYTAWLSTKDSDYDDITSFNLELSLTRSNSQSNGIALHDENLGIVHVNVTDNNRHWNKVCYSHVDPHHRTSDGVHFEMQQPGDHLLYKNTAYQIEVQQSARYCIEGWTSGPVCACGIAIRVGADAFVIDRCPGRNFIFDFVQCGDGGIIDIETTHDYRYTVRTPIGTIIDISLHTWSHTMNIDIYMSAKDFGNVVGLCGHFDGDRPNDFLYKDGETISYDKNRNYMFSDSWRLTDEENLFTNNNRVLESWTIYNNENSACWRPKSITRKKCKVPRRTKRSLRVRRGNSLENSLNPKYGEMRAKRSTEGFTENEAFNICNETIYTAPAVLDFPDRLAGEDLDIVVQQCVYDLNISNDSDWAAAHKQALNNAADTILKLNPVFVANNSDLVKSFLSKTCLNNCSQNGVCAETGLCECSGVFRGPDCRSDITIPPVVYEIQGGDICDTSSGDDCTCFVIRTDNVFEGFKCDMSKYKVYFNGSRVKESSSTFDGDYHDIFTGVCCDPFYRKKRSVDDSDVQISLYEFSVSNDGSNYGEPNSVYVYDTTCIQHDDVDGIVTFFIKDDFCFIDGVCVMHRSKIKATDECLFCDATVDQYNWSEGYCDDGKGAGLKSAALVGIIVGSVIGLAVIVVLLYFLYNKTTKKQRTIGDSHVDPHNSLPKMRPFEVKQRTGDDLILCRNSVLTPSRQLFGPAANAKTNFKRIALIRSSESPNINMSRDADNSKGDGKRIAAGEMGSSGANIEIVKAFDNVGSLRRDVSIVSGISMKSIELDETLP